MSEKFDNFGQALAWMMESPENVAVRTDLPGLSYRVSRRRLEFDTNGGDWQAATALREYMESTWSRAPRESLEFRWDAEVDRGAWGGFSIEGKEFASVVGNTLANIPEGTEFELILKEKN